MVRPRNANYILILLGIKLAWILMLYATAYYSLFSESHNIFTNIGRWPIYAFEIERPFARPNSTMGALAGHYLIPFLVITLTTIFFVSKNKIAFWVACIFELLLSLSTPLTIPLFSIGIIILGFTPSVKTYWKKISKMDFTNSDNPNH